MIWLIFLISWASPSIEKIPSVTMITRWKDPLFSERIRSKSCKSKWLKRNRCSFGRLATRMPSIMLLWFKASETTIVWPPTKESADCPLIRQNRTARLAAKALEKTIASSRPWKAAISFSKSRCTFNVPEIKRTAPGPVPNSCVAICSAAFSWGWKRSPK